MKKGIQLSYENNNTFKAIFFSLFIALNCFILESTALSIGLSDASPSLSHGCSDPAYKVSDFGERNKYLKVNVVKKLTENLG
jgi:hypothetical protein